MKYQLINNNFSHFYTYEINKLPPRAYFIPFGTRKAAEEATPLNARYTSDIVTCLSGEWDFIYYKNPDDLPVVLDTDTAVFDKLTVPSCWQYSGYGKPFYVNVRYQFFANPPVIPTGKVSSYMYRNWEGASKKATANPVDEYNSIGVYRKLFAIDDLDKEYIISFLGVASSLDLYVNGNFVGYSEGSHNTAEFNITEFLTHGENELVASVRRWSTGTYLECQDMFRNNGIFRDVLLYKNDKEYIEDIRISSKKSDFGYNLDIKLAVKNPDDSSVKINFSINGEEYYAEKPTAEFVEFSFPDLPVIEWNAEQPVLYDVYITLDNACIKQRIGFKQVEYDKGVLILNGKKIKLKGVNHHDTHPKTGFTMSADDLLKDVTLMKEYNVNTVRTSHYPPDPVFLELCNQKGLYVVDEADIEAHGVAVYLKPNWISNDLKWKNHFLDRVSRMFGRDRNNVSVLFWSLGNEAGGYRCQDECYKFLKTVTDLPVHYEGAIRTVRQAYDIRSEMYTSPNFMLTRLKKTDMFFRARKNKPYFLCEYAHAMGVGPGCLEEYWQVFYSDERFAGGCIWEWADHAVLTDKGYLYGGDHGEYVHDSNFCVDGLFYPDRSPHTGALEMKAVYRPVRASYSKGEIRFLNTNRFKSTADLDFVVETIKDGKKVSKKTLTLDIPPEGEASVKITPPDEGDVFINIAYLSGGFTVAEEQLTVTEQLPAVVPDRGQAITLDNQDQIAVITFNGGEAVFDKQSGNLISYKLGDNQFINQTPLNRWGKRGPNVNLYRVPTDNDRNIVKRWEKAGYGSCETRLNGFFCQQNDGSVTVLIKLIVTAAGKPMHTAEDVYTVFSDGTLKVECTLCPINKKGIDIPRFGKAIELDKRFNHITYYGRGEAENYPDFKAQSKIGLYKTTADIDEPYIKPQENGGKCDVRFAKFTDKKGVGLQFIAADKPFILTAHRYTADQQRAWTHTWDVEVLETVNVAIDGFMTGIGSNSCGPRTEKQYILYPDKNYTFSFFIKPVQ